MKLIQVINGEIAQHSLPKTGTLKNGSTVSGYHLLDEEILKDEGWLPLEDIKPECDAETHYLTTDGYEILEDKVIKKYKVVEIPKSSQPSKIDLLQEDINDVAELTTIVAMDKDDIAEMLVYALQKIDELEGMING